MVEDEEGFRYPSVVRASICTGCGLCIRVCPNMGVKEQRSRLDRPLAYIAYSPDDEIRALSASGGIFSSVAQKILRKGGVVFGVVADGIDSAKHIKAVTIEELKPQCNSKYIPSNVGMIFRETDKELRSGRTVLFSGTPCQIAGLLSYLGGERENLVTCDLMCHGIPSEMVYRKYLSMLYKKYGSYPVRKFRDKRYGWRPCVFTVRFENGTEISETSANSLFHRAYVNNLFQRPSCYTCRFSSIPRVADISLGDYFAYKGPVDNKGLSLVTINTAKGMMIFNEIKETLSCVECDLNIALKDNEHLGGAPRLNYFRRFFFRDLNEENYESVIKRYVHLNLFQKIYNRIRIESAALYNILTERKKNEHNRYHSYILKFLGY